MNQITPDRSERKSVTPATGVAPALVVAGLALTLTLVMLDPRRESGVDESRQVLAAEREAETETRDPSRRPLPLPPAAAKLESTEDRTEALASETDLPTELTIPCRVLDPGGWGVGGAEVWADDGEYQQRGQTATDGTFEVVLDSRRVEARLAGDLPVLVGARHPSHGPTLLVPWSEPLSGELRLALRGRGAALRLAVVDPDSRPIGGAEVVLGGSFGSRQPTGPQVLCGTGELRSVVPSPAMSTDAWGQVLLTGLEPGEQSLSVRGIGYCQRFGRIQLIEGQVVERRIQLQPACAVRGRLMLGDGGPLSEGRVMGAGEDPLSDVQALCDENDEYLLEELPAGLVQIFAENRENGRVTHTASTDCLLDPLEVATWDGILTRLEEVCGRLLNSDGGPLVGWRVELRVTGDRLRPSRFAMTAGDGRFSLPSAPRGRSTELLLFHPDSAGGIPTRVIPDVHGIPDECLLQFEVGEDRSAPIRGVVQGPVLFERGNLFFHLQRLDTEQIQLVRPDEQSGAFQTPAVPPGDYVVVFPRHGRGWAPDFRLRVRPDEPLDIGTIELEPTGILRLLPNREAPEVQSLPIEIVLLRRRVGDDFRLTVYRGRADIPLEVRLAPGRYVLEVPSRSGRSDIPFSILSEQISRVRAPTEN